jgi:hypothetical protein
MESTLPEDVANGATLRGNEYAWSLASFPDALFNAERRQFACLGGQFQVRCESAIFEMYWINADSTERQDEEAWNDYSKRSCAEVRKAFERSVAETDFLKEAAGWPDLRRATRRGIDLREWVVFVAYFVSEDEWHDSHKRFRR